MKAALGWVMFLIACKQAESPKATGSAAEPTGSGSGSATPVVDAANAAADAGVATDAAAPLAAFCLGEDDTDGTFRKIAADDHAVTFCFHLEEVEYKKLPERDKCATLDLASGTFTAVAAPPAAPEETKGPPGKPAVTIDRSKLGLPADAELETTVSPDDKTLAAVSSEANGKLFILDGATGKLRKAVAWDADGGCMERPSFIGENIYVQYNVCAGPGATGWIVTPAGKKLGEVGGVNPTGVFYELGGDRHAFEDFGGSSVAIVDGKRGKTIASISIEPPEDCDEKCPSFNPGALALVRLPGGKLVQFSSVVGLVDPAAAGAKKLEKRILWPVCTKTAP